MSMNNKVLGRGLNALFQTNQPRDAGEGGAAPFMEISCDSLYPNPDQPRSRFEDESLKELAASIHSQGMLQPILARPGDEDGKYQIIAGERRWRAAKLAGLASVPVLVRQVGDQDAAMMALVENIQREDLNPIEKAKALLHIKETLNLTLEAMAARLGQSINWVSYSIRLLELSDAAQDDLVNGRLSPGQARCLFSVTPGVAAETLRARIVETGMSVREAQEAINYWRAEDRFPWQADGDGPDTPAEKAPRKPRDPAFLQLASQIGAALNCRTRISGNAERGKISLTYESGTQLNELLAKLGLTLHSAS